MKPIETIYKGYRFRSRLEARWAVFFDCLEVEWLYENEGYELDNGQMYLPDFYLPQLKTFVEVKGEWTDSDREKFESFTMSQLYPKDGDEGNLVIPFGEIPPPDKSTFWKFVEDNHAFFVDILGYCPPAICSRCGSFCFAQDLYKMRSLTCCAGLERRHANAEDPRIFKAYAAARSSRFEHGEKGYLEEIENEQ